MAKTVRDVMWLHPQVDQSTRVFLFQCVIKSEKKFLKKTVDGGFPHFLPLFHPS